MITVIFLQPVELKDSVIFRSINLPEHVFDNLSRKSLISFSTLEESNLVITLTLYILKPPYHLIVIILVFVCNSIISFKCL